MLKGIENSSLLSLYDGAGKLAPQIAEGDQITSTQLGIFMTDVGQTIFDISATDRANESVSVTIQIERQQLMSVADQLDFGLVLPGMIVERKLLIRNTASAAELTITDINSNLGMLTLAERPNLSSEPLLVLAGQEVELIVTLLVENEVDSPRLIIYSNDPIGESIIPIQITIGHLSPPTETNLMVVKGQVEKTNAQTYANLSVGLWIERGIEVDEDGDGLEDSWEEFYFNNDLDATDGSEDSDDDGQDNWSEFHGRSNPNDALSLPQYFEDVPVNNDGSYRILLANLPTGDQPTSPVVAEGDILFVYLDDEADKGSDEVSYEIAAIDIEEGFIQIDLEAVIIISKSISIKGFDDPVVLTITDQIVGLKQPPRIQQVRPAEQERIEARLQVGVEPSQPARQIETVLKIEVPGVANTGIGGIFQDTPLGIQIPFDTTKNEPVDVITLISVDLVNKSETVEILETEVVDGSTDGSKLLKSQLKELN